MIFALISNELHPTVKGKLPQEGGPFKAAFFDYWETLVEEREKGGARIPALKEQILGLSIFKGIDPEKAEEALVSHWQAVSHRLTLEPKEHPLDLFFSEILSELGKTVSRQELEEALSSISETIDDQTCLLSGAKEFLLFLRERSIKIGLISNTQLPPLYVEKGLKNLGLLSLFDSLTLSSALGYRKPAPQIFHAALKSLGVKAENSLHFGDSLYYDIEGAKQVGLLPIQILASRFHPPAEAEIVIQDWNTAKLLFQRVL